MTVEVTDLLAGIQIVDSEGRPTIEFLELFQRLVDSARDHEDRLDILDGGSP